MKKRKIRYFVIFATVLTSIGSLCYLIWKGQYTEPPTMSVSIKEFNISEENVFITWSVKNKSEQILTFDENQVAQIEWNGNPVFYPMEGVSMAPDEENVYTLSLTGVNIDPINTVKITATSNEGTRGAIQKTVYMTTQNT